MIRNRDPSLVNGAVAWLVLLLSASFVAAEDFAPDEVVVYKRPRGGEPLSLHVFKPETTEASDTARGEGRPCIIFFFGGGWRGGTPRQFYPQADTFRDRGLVAISAEYRTSSSHGVTPQACVADGKSAVRWCREHADKLGVAPEKIIAAGGSAGGHVAACTGVLDGFDDKDENVTITSKPNAMVLFNPVIDTTEKGYGASKVGADKTALSPCHHVKSGIPPTLVFHGTGDKTVPFENVQRFTRLMKEAGNECELVAFEGRPHGFFNSSWFRKSNTDEDYRHTMDKAVRWLTALGLIAGRESSPNSPPEAGAAAPGGDQETRRGPAMERERPSVLILGDSISMGYTPYVRRFLKGQAEVFRTGNGRENNQGTTYSLKHIDRYLRAREYDIIHFNWGLHDLKHVKIAGSQESSDSFNDPRQAEPEVYRNNLEALVAKLKQTGAKLIFATTTPYPAGVKPARLPADARLYNEIALEIMKANDIQVNDLYSLALPKLSELQKPKNVHFTAKGSEVLAKQVADVIRSASEPHATDESSD